MAKDVKTEQVIFHGATRSGLRNVGSYQVSGHPWITGSDALAQNEVQRISFPYVTKTFTVINTNTTAGDDIRVHFESGSAVTAVTVDGRWGEQTITDAANVIAGLHYITVPAGYGSVTFDAKCKKVYLSQNARNADFTYQVFAELTTILAGSMFELTGSGITDWT